MRRVTLVLLAMAISLGTAARVSAHCEIPCGIYDDRLRADLITEHAGTIEKSMNQIIALGKENPVNYNQLVRWINNKDDHADKIQDIVYQYFMTQRIHLDTPRYNEKLRALHEMLIYAMLCKQTTDTANVAKLRDALKRFEALYFTHAHKKQSPAAKKKR